MSIQNGLARTDGPEGISLFPHNRIFAILFLIAMFGFVASLIAFKFTETIPPYHRYY
jgi:hypothetical protein